MTIREYLRKLGATDAEMKAKVIERMENAMMFDTDLSLLTPDTVLQIITSAASAVNASCSELERAEGRINASIKNADKAADKLTQCIKEADSQMDFISKGLSGNAIRDTAAKDAVLAFAYTLRSTKEIFGEEALTPEVMIAAINAGSYIAWRDIMGPKQTTSYPTKRV